MTLAAKTILISGGSRGIGLAIALKAAADGANIALLAKTDTPHPKLPGTIHTAAEEITAAGGRALSIVGDVRNDDDIDHAITNTVAHFGGIDILINNASVIDLSRTEKLTEKHYDLMQDVNVRGTFMLTRAALPYLAQAPNPHILSLSPPINLNPFWLGAHTGYTLAKYGMTLATLGIAAEYEKTGISASTLWPKTTIATAAVRNLLGGEAVIAASRTPEIYADAAYLVLNSPATGEHAVSGRSLIVEDVLAAHGITDFTQYAVTPGTPDNELYPDVFLGNGTQR